MHDPVVVKALLGSVAMFILALMLTTVSETGSKSPKEDTEKKICRTIVDLGSRLSRTRICMTAEQWDEHDKKVEQRFDHDRAWRGQEGH